MCYKQLFNRKYHFRLNKAHSLEEISEIANVEILNPELTICNINEDIKFNIDIKIKKGRGYHSSEKNKEINKHDGIIAIDSIFTPIKNVNYNIENYRVGQKTDYEKLNINITTDGSIDPKLALTEA